MTKLLIADSLPSLCFPAKEKGNFSIPNMLLYPHHFSLSHLQLCIQHYPHADCKHGAILWMEWMEQYDLCDWSWSLVARKRAFFLFCKQPFQNKLPFSVWVFSAVLAANVLRKQASLLARCGFAFSRVLTVHICDWSQYELQTVLCLVHGR